MRKSFSNSNDYASKVTYDAFIHALSDRPQDYDIFKDKASGIARNIGVKNDKEKSDLADTAIADFWSHSLDKFDPKRGEFSKYFNECIGNTIRSEIRKNGKSFRLSASGRTGIDNENILVGEDNDVDIKKREFADKMTGEFKRFIDNLKPEDLMIFCASEFGKLIVDSDAYADIPTGRNYAEIIAARTGRTTEAVRKIASRLKERAIGCVAERGYDRGKFNSIGFMTTKPQANPMDFSTLDWSSLSGIQRLHIRMYLYNKALLAGIF